MLLNNLGKLRSRAALGVLLAAASSGCGGISPGDYLIYRVALSKPALSPECFADGMVPPNEAEDTSTLRNSGAMILYAGADDRYFLDFGTGTVEGTRLGDDFTFSARDFDVTIDGPMNEIRQTQEDIISIEFTLDGELIDGTLRNTQNTSCEGPMGSCPMPSNTSCTQTSGFVGTEVHDVDIEHDV